jgi:hypothetical protein
MLHYNDFDQVQENLLEEVKKDIVLDRAGLIASSVISPKNRFKTRIQGFVIQDTVNNPIFPIDYPPIDKGNGYIGKIFKQYIAKYQKQYKTNTLPWHYVVEFNKVQGFYVVNNTRPVNLHYPLKTKEMQETIDKNGANLINGDSENLMNSGKELQEMIHILVVGNSELDVYTKDLYDKIGSYIIGPLSKQHKVTPLIREGTFFLNMGKKFKPNVLKKYIKKL